MSKVRCLYDFQAEDPNELTTHTGEELTVISTTLYDGWVQVRNAKGGQGIVPTSYVEYINDDDDIPPPPSSSYDSYGAGGATTAAWNTPAPASSYVNAPSFTTSSYQNNNQWSSAPSTTTNSWGATNANSATSWGASTSTPTTFSGGAAAPASAHGKVNRNFDDDSDDFSDDDGPRGGNTANSNAPRGSNILSNTTNASSTGTLSKLKSSKNPYSLEAFLLHGAIKNVSDSDRFSTIVQNEQRQSMWKRTSPPYQVNIMGYSSDKKYHGVKKFISYEIKANIFPQRVKRRYNHFDWLHERLVEKYPNICVPPIPGKAATGNFDDDFIAKRKSLLELWLNRMAAHPVVGQSEVFIHFLQCDDASSKWKAGKRKAEKDEYHGAQWFCTLTVPGESVDTTTGIKERVDKFAKATNNLNYCFKNVNSSLEKIATNHSTVYKKEMNNMGKRFEEMGITLSNDSLEAPNNSLLSDAFVTAGNTYAQIGNMYGEQAKTDIVPLLDKFQMYQGVLQQMPDIIQIEKSAIQLYEEFQQKPEKLEGRSLMDVAPRREIISHVTFAEINQFNRDKVDEMALCMKTFLQQQIAFYTEVTECLKRASAAFEKIPVSASAAASQQSMRR